MFSPPARYDRMSKSIDRSFGNNVTVTFVRPGLTDLADIDVVLRKIDGEDYEGPGDGAIVSRHVGSVGRNLVPGGLPDGTEITDGAETYKLRNITDDGRSRISFELVAA